MKKLLLLVFAVVLIGVLVTRIRAAGLDEPEPEVLPKNGDIVFQTSQSRQSVWIQDATSSPYSHVGIVEKAPDGLFVIEAIQPVSRTPWAKWWRRGVHRRVTIFRFAALTRTEAQDVIDVAKAFLGKPYDDQFAWDDERIYCSELIEKAFDRGANIRLGRMQPLGSLHTAGMERVLKERFGSPIPYDRNLITPTSIAKDDRLTFVWSSFPSGRN